MTQVFTALEVHRNEEKTVRLLVKDMKSIGKGTFGRVFKAYVKMEEYGSEKAKGGERPDSQDENLEFSLVAIKKIDGNSRIYERELHVLKVFSHPNLLAMKYYYTSMDKVGGNDGSMGANTLNIVMEYIPNNLHHLYQSYLKTENGVSPFFVKLIVYQLARGLAYLHNKRICHRDIKPLNLLVKAPTHALKICDFGSSKEIVEGEKNLSYICSRYYRAPELVFGCRKYSFQIDMWSTGCVLAELMLGHPIFIANSSIDLVCSMARVLGTPTLDDMREINEAFCKYPLPLVKSQDMTKVFYQHTGTGLVELVAQLLTFSPSRRMSAPTMLFQPAFHELFEQAACAVASGRQTVPSLTDFTEEELSFCPQYSNLAAVYQEKLSRFSRGR